MGVLLGVSATHSINALFNCRLGYFFYVQARIVNPGGMGTSETKPTFQIFGGILQIQRHSQTAAPCVTAVCVRSENKGG